MSKTWPVVTVGIPVLNEEKFIEKAVRSILNQSYKNIRIVISNNKSDDKTGDILLSLEKSDDRVRIFNQDERIGPYQNFEFVMNEATSKYFMWHAGDDYLEPDFVSQLVEVLERDPDVVCAMSDVAVVDEEENYLYSTKLSSIREVRKSKLISGFQFFKNPTDTKYMAIYGIFRTEVVQLMDMTVGGHLKFNRGSEIPQLAQVSLHGKIVSLPIILKNYRSRKDSLFTSESQKMSSIILKLHNYINLQYCLFWVVIKSIKPLWFKLFCLFFLISYPGYYLILKVVKNIK